LEKLKTDIQEKDLEIKALQETHSKQVEQLNQSIYDLSEKLMTSMHLATINQDTASAANVESLNAALYRKERELSSLKDEYEARLSALNFIVEDLTVQLSEAHSMLPIVKGTLHDALERLAAKESEYHDLNAQFEKQVASLKDRISELQEELKNVESDHKEDTMEMDALKEENALNASYKELIESLRAQLAQKEEELVMAHMSHEKEASEMSNVMTVLREQLYQLEQTSRQAGNQQETVNELEALVHEISSQLDNKDTILDALHFKLAEKERVVESLEQEHISEKGALQQVIHDLNDTIQQIQNEFDHATAHSNAIQQVLENLQEKYDDVRDVMSRKEHDFVAQLQEKSDLLVQCQRDGVEMKQSIAHLTAQLEDKLIAIKTITERYESERASLETEVSSLREQLGQPQNAPTGESLDHLISKEQPDQLSAQLSESQTALEAKTAEIQQLHTSLESSLEQTAEQQREIETLRQQLMNARVEVRDITTEPPSRTCQVNDSILNMSIMHAILRSQLHDQVLHNKELEKRYKDSQQEALHSAKKHAPFESGMDDMKRQWNDALISVPVLNAQPSVPTATHSSLNELDTLHTESQVKALSDALMNKSVIQLILRSQLAEKSLLVDGQHEDETTSSVPERQVDATLVDATKDALANKSIVHLILRSQLADHVSCVKDLQDRCRDLQCDAVDAKKGLETAPHFPSHKAILDTVMTSQPADSVTDRNGTLEGLQRTTASSLGDLQMNAMTGGPDDQRDSQVSTSASELEAINDSLASRSVMGSILRSQLSDHVTLLNKLKAYSAEVESMPSPIVQSAEVELVRELLFNKSIMLSILCSQLSDKVSEVNDLKMHVQSLQDKSASAMADSAVMRVIYRSQVFDVKEEMMQLEERVKVEESRIAGLRDKLSHMETMTSQGDPEQLNAQLQELQEQKEALKAELSSFSDQHASLKLMIHATYRDQLCQLESQLSETTQELTKSVEKCRQYEEQLGQVGHQQSVKLFRETEQKEQEQCDSGLSLELDGNLPID
jgi:chromosome segregation ATPase